MWIAFKEWIRGSLCWNCKRKKACKSYQATKHLGDTVTICVEKGGE